jgi:signal transduction histidine kinase
MTELTTTTILYIEDDPASRSLVERTLKFAGYRVLIAERGLQGIDLARRELPDLILTDINLPDLTGREIATTLKADPRFLDTPIVALTAQALREQRDMAMVAGLTGYLLKPLDVETLPRQIDFYLRGGQDLVDRDNMQQAQARYTQEVAMKLEARIRELERYNEDLMRLDHMKDAFINIAAHELRTPLTLLIGYNRLMAENPHMKALLIQDEGTRLLVEGMTQSIGRMQIIVNEILTINRIVSNKLDLNISPTNLADLVARAVQQYVPTLRERKLTLHFDRADFPEHIYADSELIELVVRNLLSNAIKYTPDGGTIIVSAKVDQSADPKDSSVRVSVRDTGIGIAREDLSRIFERFNSIGDPLLHSTSKTAFRGGGIGLGLAVSKGVIEAHGGRIWAESTAHDPERCPGSEFVFVLPLAAVSRRTTSEIRKVI